jgi:hypothetical protein
VGGFHKQTNTPFLPVKKKRIFVCIKVTQILMKTLIVTEKEQIEDIIAKCTICYVGMADTDGTPYVFP